MDFDQKFLEEWGKNNNYLTERDDSLRAAGVDPQKFHDWQKDSWVSNECGTDEYRETQPSKGLGWIADFLADNCPGEEACREVELLTVKWLNVWNEAHDPEKREQWEGVHGWAAYAGAEELLPIAETVFEWNWAMGYPDPYSQPGAVEPEVIDYYKEDTA